MRLLLTFIAAFIAYAASAQRAQGFADVQRPSLLDSLVYQRTLNNLQKKNKDLFKVQIYSGTREGADEKLADFSTFFSQQRDPDKPEVKPEIVFETPNYKVRVGVFRGRLEADRWLLKLRKRYPQAFIF